MSSIDYKILGRAGAGSLIAEFLFREIGVDYEITFVDSEKYKFDVKAILLEKIKKNGEKYPIEKAKGTAKKYNEL